MNVMELFIQKYMCGGERIKFKSRMVRNIGPPNLAVISAEGILIIIEWHNFTGADWDGKFMVATKKRSVHRVLQTNHTPANLALRHP